MSAAVVVDGAGAFEFAGKCGGGGVSDEVVVNRGASRLCAKAANTAVESDVDVAPREAPIQEHANRGSRVITCAHLRSGEGVAGEEGADVADEFDGAVLAGAVEGFEAFEVVDGEGDGVIADNQHAGVANGRNAEHFRSGVLLRLDHLGQEGDPRDGREEAASGEFHGATW